MIPELFEIIYQYLDIDDIYRLKIKIDLKLYLKNVKVPTGREKSYQEYKVELIENYQETDTNLKWACFAGYIEIAKYYLKKYKYNKLELEESLNLALCEEHLDIIKLLVNFGVSIDNISMTCLYHQNKVEVFEYFKDKGDFYNLESILLEIDISGKVNRPTLIKYLGDQDVFAGISLFPAKINRLIFDYY